MGDVIAPAPLLHIWRDDSLNEYEEDYDDGTVQPFHEYQLLLNYCFSHPRSSLLLYPYSPVVNYINHDGKEPNAFIRWSGRKYHKSEWLDRTVEDIIDNEAHPGLILEFVAARDIDAGEEIFINYGEGWEEAWNKYVKDWESDPNDENYIPLSTLNEYPTVL
eukprot:7639372-Ditylum_brightwellii.AAC.1